MSPRITNCPNCGGQVEFKAGASLLTVCPYCSSAVGRVGDDITQLEILGQVAPLAALASPLSLGMRGEYEGRAFTIVGRLQLDYGLGPWNEWYLVFDEVDAWGWLAEAQGRVYVTFRVEADALPGYAEAAVGRRIMAKGSALTVTERRRARFVGAEGELPFTATPGAYVYYCDVEGSDGVFGTLDYGDAPAPVPEALFLGREVAYDALFDHLEPAAPTEAAGAVGMNCPNCGASVELRAPDDAQRVTCGSCESLLDCGPGNELFLLSAARRGGPEPKLPLGGVGELDGRKWTVYGQLTRSVTYEGIRYQWEEYLLRNERRGGYRWLIFNQGHWTWVHPVHAGDVSGTGRSVEHKGERFQHFQSSSATVDALRGEFYWKVAVGDQVGMMDFIRPPQLLSRETGADEVTWSMGAYIDRAEVQAAFGIDHRLPTPRGVAPNQPNPHGRALSTMLKLGGLFTGILLVAALVMSALSDDALVMFERIELTNPPGPQRAYVKGNPVKKRFTVKGDGNMSITVTSDVRNTWLYVAGRLIDETHGTTRDFGVQVTYHNGYEGGQSWSTGGRKRTVYLGGLSAGDYSVTLTPEWSGAGQPPTRFDLAIRSQVFMGTHALMFAFLLWILPLLQAVRYYVFEKQRWAESDYA